MKATKAAAPGGGQGRPDAIEMLVKARVGETRGGFIGDKRLPINPLAHPVAGCAPWPG